MRAQHERRRSSRVDTCFLGEWNSGDFFAPGEVVDMSQHGLFLTTVREAMVGTLVELRLHLPDGAAPIHCYAWVRFCAPGRGLGLELFAMSDLERNRWMTYYVRCLDQARRQAA